MKKFDRSFLVTSTFAWLRTNFNETVGNGIASLFLDLQSGNLKYRQLVRDAYRDNDPGRLIEWLNEEAWVIG